MTAEEFRDKLHQLDITQAEVVKRLAKASKGFGPIYGTVNRWYRGLRPIPDDAAKVIRSWKPHEWMVKPERVVDSK